MTSNWRDVVLTMAMSVEVAKFNDIYPWGTLLLIQSAFPSNGKGVGLRGLLLYCSTPESLRDSQGETTWPKFSKGPPSAEVSFQSSLLPCHHRHSHPGCHWDAEWPPHPWGLRCWETVLWSSLLKIPITHGWWCWPAIPVLGKVKQSHLVQPRLHSKPWSQHRSPSEFHPVNKCFQSICLSKYVLVVCGSHYRILNGTAACGPYNCSRKLPLPPALKALWQDSFLCLNSGPPNLPGRSHLSQSTLCWWVLHAHLDAVRAQLCPVGGASGLCKALLSFWQHLPQWLHPWRLLPQSSQLAIEVCIFDNGFHWLQP